MFVDLCIFSIGIPRKTISHFLHFLSPPANLIPGDLVFDGGSFKLGECPGLDFLFLGINHPPDLVELLSNLIEDVLTFTLNNSLVLVYYCLSLTDILDLVIQATDVSLVVDADATQR